VRPDVPEERGNPEGAGRALRGRRLKPGLCPCGLPWEQCVRRNDG
jgi:hypothetical protein